MVDDVSVKKKIACSINPGAKITTDIALAPTRDNLSQLNHSNPTTTTKFRCQTKNQQQTPKQQHEATHQATAYDTQIEQPKQTEQPETAYNAQIEQPKKKDQSRKYWKGKYTYVESHTYELILAQINS